MTTEHADQMNKRPSYGDTAAKRKERDEVSSVRLSQTNRIARATSDIFRAPPDTIHIDRKGAKLVRGNRY